MNQYYWVGADNVQSQSLDMGQNKHLSHVLLSRIAPAAVRLPPACALALNGSLEMCARLWRNSLAQSPLEQHLAVLHVTTSKLCHQSPGDGAAHPPPVDVLFSLSDKLQHIFAAGCSRLTHLYLTCASFGTAEGPIRLSFNSFPCLTTLRLVVAQGAGIFLSVSTAVPLEAVKLDARTGVLFLELDDEAAFAESLVVLETRHSTVRGDSLRQLAGELARRPGCQLADLGDTLVWCAHQNVKATLAGYFSQASVHDEAAMELACDCGACQVCLVRAGALLPF